MCLKKMHSSQMCQKIEMRACGVWTEHKVTASSYSQNKFWAVWSYAPEQKNEQLLSGLFFLVFGFYKTNHCEKEFTAQLSMSAYEIKTKRVIVFEKTNIPLGIFFQIRIPLYKIWLMNNSLDDSSRTLNQGLHQKNIRPLKISNF